jgi:hypothetical protein
MLPSPTEVNATAEPTADTLPIEDQRLAMRAGHEQDIDQLLDIPFYSIDMTVATDPLLIQGTEKVRYVNRSTTPLDSIVFRLYLNGLVGSRLAEVSDIKIDGSAVEPVWSVSDSVVTLPLAQPLAPGVSTTVSMSFNMTLSEDFEASYGRIGNINGVIALASFVPMLAVYQDRQWEDSMPVPLGDPAFSEVSFFDVDLSTPIGYQVASSGVVVGRIQTEESTQYHIVTGPMRDFALLMSQEFETIDSQQDDVKVTIWSAPGSESADDAALEMTLTSLSVFDTVFGEYPFKELDIIETPITAGGIEYPGLIYIASDVWDPGIQFFEVVISHEVGHQWWYSMVGNDQINEPWLDEALANYSVEVYYREAVAPAAGDSLREFYQESLDFYLSDNNQQGMPVDLPVSAYDDRAYSTFVYEAGSLFYSHLADDYGQDKVYAYLKAYYNRFRYKIVTTDDIRQMVGEFFGEDAIQFFDEWIKGES